MTGFTSYSRDPQKRVEPFRHCISISCNKCLNLGHEGFLTELDMGFKCTPIKAWVPEKHPYIEYMSLGGASMVRATHLTMPSGFGGMGHWIQYLSEGCWRHPVVSHNWTMSFLLKWRGVLRHFYTAKPVRSWLSTPCNFTILLACKNEYTCVEATNRINYLQV